MHMKISARNSLKGTISAITVGPVSTEVTIKIAPNLELVSVITTNSSRKLKLKVGQKAYAIVKSDNVIVGVD
jgi:molybdopterin-binding protein